jgi:hypothetical protein
VVAAFEEADELDALLAHRGLERPSIIPDPQVEGA